MAVGNTAVQPRVSFDTTPDSYRHWKLSFDGAIATLAMDVQEDAGLSPDYRLKLNSYDLGVDIELADAVQRIRFEHPEVHAVVVTSLKERIFCAGANIFMLRGSSHAWKVNFCKFTNETRLAIEDASAHSGLKFLAALNGICAGGGYELALACDEIVLVDDGNSAVSLPETPLLAVLPGTGGLTRVVDKRKVRRDLADVFGTVAEGVKGQARGRMAARRCRVSDQPVQGPGREARGGVGGSIGSTSLRPGHQPRPAGAHGHERCGRVLECLAADRSRRSGRDADRQGPGHATAGDTGGDPDRGRRVLAAARLPRARRRRFCTCASTSRSSAPSSSGPRAMPRASWPSTRRCSRTRITGSFAKSCTS